MATRQKPFKEEHPIGRCHRPCIYCVVALQKPPGVFVLYREAAGRGAEDPGQIPGQDPGALAFVSWPW